MPDILYLLIFLPKGTTIPVGGTVEVPPEKATIRGFWGKEQALIYAARLMETQELLPSKVDILLHEVHRRDKLAIQVNAFVE